MYAELIGSTSLPDRIEAAPIESKRFNLRVGRLHLGRDTEIETDEIVALVSASGLDVVIVRYPASAVTWFARLRADGYVAIHADTLVYYRKLLDDLPRLPEGFATRPATERDLETVAALVTDMFDGYGNHYLSNPLFHQDHVLAGYIEWGQRYVRDGPDRAAVIIENAATRSIVGLATVETGPPGEIALAGLTAPYRGKGYYPILLDAAAIHLHGIRCAEMYISTQIHNVRAIRAWSSNGFTFDSAFQTVHLVRTSCFDSLTDETRLSTEPP